MHAEIVSLFNWVDKYSVIIWWIGALSAIIFLIFLFAIPIFIVKLPADFFIRPSLPTSRLASPKHPLVRLIYLTTKNLLAVMIILAGIAMLFLPGQGVVTIIIGVSLLNIRGKRRLVLSLVCHKFIIQSLNRLRARFNKPAFQVSKCN